MTERRTRAEEAEVADVDQLDTRRDSVQHLDKDHPDRVAAEAASKGDPKPFHTNQPGYRDVPDAEKPDPSSVMQIEVPGGGDEMPGHIDHAKLAAKQDLARAEAEEKAAKADRK